MPVITDAAAAWSAPVTLASEELWQVRSGLAWITTDDPAPADDAGWLVPAPHSLRLSAGSVVRYRRGPEPTVLVHGPI